MIKSKFPHQPTVRQLLNCEALAEAQVVHGQELLDRPVMQVVTSLTPPPRSGSLVITRASAFGNQEQITLKELAGVAVIKPYTPINESGAFSQVIEQATVSDGEIQHLAKLCRDADTPLIVLPGFGDNQSADDVRLAFLGELKRASSRLHAHLVSLVIAEGLPGLIEELFAWINRPMLVETADFKVLAAKNMASTPVSQQKILTGQLADVVNREFRLTEQRIIPDSALKPIKIGRRLVFAIVLDDVVVGYLSVYVKPADDVDTISEYMAPAALACMVDFSQRRKDVSTLSVTYQSLLKDLLLGRSLSAADQEHLERHFGFDLCDGLFVFALQVVLHNKEANKNISWPSEPYVSTEIEGTRIYVIPYDHKKSRSWQQEAENLIALIGKATPDLKVQLGSSRLAKTILDLPDSYHEARQALIISSMIQGEKAFAVGYGDLGIKRLLYLLFDHPELERFYQENLAPLAAYDTEWESELLPTLAVYLRQGANLNSAARALYIHRHTLRYRLEQIADILQVDIDSQEVLLNLQIAFMIKDMKGKL